MDKIGYKLPLLTFDHYPNYNQTKNIDDRHLYLLNLHQISNIAKDKNIPFWNFFNVLAYGRGIVRRYLPTKAMIKWQIFCYIAYGCRGILYFCYGTPLGYEFGLRNGLVDRNGKPTEKWFWAKEINTRVISMSKKLSGYPDKISGQLDVGKIKGNGKIVRKIVRKVMK